MSTVVSNAAGIGKIEEYLGAEARNLLAGALARLPSGRRHDAVFRVVLHREVSAACARAGLAPPA